MGKAEEKIPEDKKSSAKKIRCPYCKEIGDWKGGGKCPSCGKHALKPSFYVRKDFIRHERKPRSVIMPWMLSGTMWNYGAALGKLPRWVVYIGVVCIAGAFYFAPRMTNEAPELQEVTRYNLDILGIALERFKEDCGRYPSTAEGLEALVKDSQVKGWQGPYIDRLRNDSWKRPFRYASVGETILLFSSGCDGVDGTGDDVFRTPKSPEQEQNPKVDGNSPMVTVLNKSEKTDADGQDMKAAETDKKEK